MSTSLLYHAFGLRDYHFVRNTFREGVVHFAIEHAPVCRVGFSPPSPRIDGTVG